MRVLVAILGVLAASVAVSAQCPAVMPSGTVCISQEAANRAAELARTAAAKDEKIAVLEAALIDKDKIIEANKATAAKNEADLRAAMHNSDVELASKTGQLIGAEAANVRLTAIVDVLLKHVKPKKIGLINF